VSTGPGRDRIFDEVEDFELNLEGRLGSGDDRLRLSGLRGRVVVDVDAGLGFDRMWGGPGADQLFGNKGNDTLEGLAGNDRLIGGEGDDRLIGGEGDDTFVCGPGNDTAVVIDHNDVDENCETIKRP
jgi:Ca2+-binding RTX toxin-like protein